MQSSILKRIAGPNISMFHFLTQRFSVRARENIALSTLPAKQHAPKHVITCVT